MGQVSGTGRMKSPLFTQAGFARGMLALFGALQAACPMARAEGGQVTAVSSQVSADYSRVTLPDGTYQPETYTFGEGGHYASAMKDNSIDKLKFIDLAQIIAPALAKQNYVPETDRDPNRTKLLIMVYWGTTNGAEGASNSEAYQNLQSNQGTPTPPPTPPPSGAHGGSTGNDNSARANAARQDSTASSLAVVAAENRNRDENNERTAQLLGYDGELASTSGLELTAFHNRREELIAEIEESRYFIVLMAYDFQALWKHKQHKLVWVTRFSIRERGTNFDKVLPAMTDYASAYFGQDSGGLLRKPLPEGHVEIGVPKVLDATPGK
jgi:hypothetical protein